jgi:hypothetical protein
MICLKNRAPTQQGQGPTQCNTIQGASSQCRGAQAQKNQFPGTRGQRG